MNERVKKLWLDKLAVSKQTTGCLHDPDNDSYCCLGALTQCYLDEKDLCWEDMYNLRPYRDTHVYGWQSTLDLVVVEWAGLYNSDPIVDIVLEDAEYDTATLTTLNDWGMTFTEISKYIEKL